LAGVLIVFAAMMLSGWETDSNGARAASAVTAGFMLLFAAGIAAPTRFKIAMRIAAGIVAAACLAYLVTEVTALLQGERQEWHVGRPSAVNALLAMFFFGVPALVYALGGVTVGWFAQMLARMRGIPPTPPSEVGLPGTSMNFDQEHVGEFLGLVAQAYPAGFTSDDVARITREIDALPLDDEGEWKLQLRIDSRVEPLLIFAFKDDINSPDLSFNSSADVIKAIETMYDAFTEKHGI
jgi:hypothetical protein